VPHSNFLLTQEWVSKSAVGKLFRPAQFEEGHESEGAL
jgi:hypothetical protein